VWDPISRNGREKWGTRSESESKFKIKVKGNGQECPFHTNNKSLPFRWIRPAFERLQNNHEKACVLCSVIVNYNTSDPIVAWVWLVSENSDPKVKEDLRRRKYEIPWYLAGGGFDVDLDLGFGAV
jgi:hypothetical protein